MLSISLQQKATLNHTFPLGVSVLYVIWSYISQCINSYSIMPFSLHFTIVKHRQYNQFNGILKPIFKKEFFCLYRRWRNSVTYLKKQCPMSCLDAPVWKTVIWAIASLFTMNLNWQVSKSETCVGFSECKKLGKEAEPWVCSSVLFVTKF